jgi:hypothetical protein
MTGLVLQYALHINYIRSSMSSRVRSAAIGAITSGLIGIGSLAGEHFIDQADQADRIECLKEFEGTEQEICIAGINESIPRNGLGLLQFAGFAGIISCGFIGYSSLKEESKAGAAAESASV